MKKKIWLTKRRILLIVFGIIIFLYSLTMLMPIYYMVVNSIKRMDDFLENGGWALPKQLYFENYVNVFKLGGQVSFAAMFFNSVIYTLAAVSIQTATATMTAYVLSRFQFRGRNFLVALGVGAMFIPNLGSSSTIYKLYLDLGIMDTWFILIQNAGPYGLTFLMIYSLFTTVAKTYTEAAELDGAREFTIFLRIVTPMAMGMICAMMMISGIAAWNDYYTPYMYLPSIKMLSVGLQELALTISQFQRPALFAGMVIGIAPVLIVFIVFHDTIIKSTAAGGIKG